MNDRIRLVALLVCAMTSAAQAALSQQEADKLANAIYYAEGGARTRFPYGVKSVRPRDPRAACISTIQTAHGDWLRYARNNGWAEFLPYLGFRYCPPEADPEGHVNWVRNVRTLLR